jgi:STAS domain-containing protein
LDNAAVGPIDERLRELKEAGFRDFFLDLRRLRLIDSTGLRLVVEWDAAARQNGISFAVIEGPAGAWGFEYRCGTQIPTRCETARLRAAGASKDDRTRPLDRPGRFPSPPGRKAPPANSAEPAVQRVFELAGVLDQLPFRT